MRVELEMTDLGSLEKKRLRRIFSRNREEGKTGLIKWRSGERC